MFGDAVFPPLAKPLPLSHRLESCETGASNPLSSAARQLCKPLGLPGVLLDPLLRVFRQKQRAEQRRLYWSCRGFKETQRDGASTGPGAYPVREGCCHRCLGASTTQAPYRSQVTGLLSGKLRQVHMRRVSRGQATTWLPYHVLRTPSGPRPRELTQVPEAGSEQPAAPAGATHSLQEGTG